MTDVTVTGTGTAVTLSGDGTTVNVTGTGTAVTADVASGVSTGYVDSRVQVWDNDAGESVWTVTDDTGLSLYQSNEVAYTDAQAQAWGSTYFFDGSASGFLTGADGTVRHYSPDIGDNLSILVTTVEPGDPFAAPRELITVQGAPVDVTFTFGGPIVDCGGGVGFMVLHTEYGVFGDPWYWFRLDAAKVVDNGTTRTVTWLGPLISHQLTKATAEAQSYTAGQGQGTLLEWSDGYVYCYHQDYKEADGSLVNTVSRCLRSSIVTAMAADSVPTFGKWQGGSDWSGDPLTGLGSAVLGLNDAGQYVAESNGDLVTLPDGRILWVRTETSGSVDPRLVYTVGTGPLTWEAGEVTVLAEAADTNREWYAAMLWSGDPNSPKAVTRGSVQAYWVDADSQVDRWANWDVRRATIRPTVGSQEPAYLVSTAGTVDLGDTTTYPYPGKVVVLTDGVTVQLPPVVTRQPRRWTIVNSSGTSGAVSTVAVTDAAGSALSVSPLPYLEQITVTSTLDTGTWIPIVQPAGNRPRTWPIAAAGATFSLTANEIDGADIGLGANAVVSADIRDGSASSLIFTNNLSNGDYALIVAEGGTAAGFDLGLYRVASPTWEFITPAVGDFAVITDSSANDQLLGTLYTYEGAGGGGIWNGWSYVLWGVIRNVSGQYAGVTTVDSSGGGTLDMAASDTVLTFLGTFLVTGTGNVTLTLPSAASYFGRTIRIVKQASGGTITMAAQAGQSIASGTTSITGTDYAVHTYLAVTTTAWVEV